MKIVKLLFVLCVVAGCSREQTAAAGNAIAKPYAESNRDSIIKNWQAKVASTPNCSQFKEQFWVVGNRYESAAVASFHVDMTKVWDAAKAAQCAATI